MESSLSMGGAIIFIALFTQNYILGQQQQYYNKLLLLLKMSKKRRETFKKLAKNVKNKILISERGAKHPIFLWSKYTTHVLLP